SLWRSDSHLTSYNLIIKDRFNMLETVFNFLDLFVDKFLNQSILRFNKLGSAMITGGENSVNLGDKMGYQGGYHNHTPTGIKIFAPEDIESLLEFSIYQGSGGHNSVFLGMIG